MALCLCSKQCSVICSEIARHMLVRSPCVTHSKSGEGAFRGMVPKAVRENGFWFSFFHFLSNLSFPYRSCAKSLEGKEREGLQFLSEAWCHGHMTAFCRSSSGTAGTGKCHGREAVVNASQSSEH